MQLGQFSIQMSGSSEATLWQESNGLPFPSWVERMWTDPIVINSQKYTYWFHENDCVSRFVAPCSKKKWRNTQIIKSCGILFRSKGVRYSVDLLQRTARNEWDWLNIFNITLVFVLWVHHQELDAGCGGDWGWFSVWIGRLSYRNHCRCKCHFLEHIWF